MISISSNTGIRPKAVGGRKMRYFNTQSKSPYHSVICRSLRLHATTDCGGGDDGGGKGKRRSRFSNEDDDNSRPEGYVLKKLDLALWMWFIWTSWSVTAATATAAPSTTHAGVAGQVSVNESLDQNLELSGVLANSDSGSVSQSDDLLRLKRLQRELFARMVETKQRLDDLEAAKEANEEESFIPSEGSGVAPRSRSLSRKVAYRSQIHLSGGIEASAIMPWHQSVQSVDPTSTDTVSSLEHLGLSVGPDAELLLQTLWPSKKQSLTGKFSITSNPSIRTIRVTQLLVRREAGPMRLLLAPMGGSLGSISRRINPSADFGLTPAMRQGHDIPMASEGGMGLAGTWISSGLASASAGHFLSGDPGHPLTRHHSVAQISLHHTRRLAASFVISSTSSSSNLTRAVCPTKERPFNFLLSGIFAPSASGPCDNTQVALRPHVPDDTHNNIARCSTSSSPHSDAAAVTSRQHSRTSQRQTAADMAGMPPPFSSTAMSSEPSRVIRKGIAASLLLGEAAIVSAWGVGGAQGGYGGRLSTVPNDSGVVVAAMACRTCDTANARGPEGPDVPSRRMAEIFELSASVPVADGICLTPGFVAARQRGWAVIVIACVSIHLAILMKRVLIG